MYFADSSEAVLRFVHAEASVLIPNFDHWRENRLPALPDGIGNREPL